MKRRWIIPFLVLVVILLAVAVIVFVLPNVSNAPTTHGPGSTTTGTVAPTPATLPDTITVDQPLPEAAITSPLTITGKARGNWFFEASAPVELKDASGVVIAHGIAQAQGDWMTTNFVPFTATLTFTKPVTKTGTLVLKNDNPSGDPAKQKQLNIPVVFQ
ncbi:MAG: hypothetical protein QG621_630 [Patescibacteria group bacterium]|jgi:hypothetical protein|nr:hypothetical protein [Patescibacteria group bacterium]